MSVIKTDSLSVYPYLMIQMCYPSICLSACYDSDVLSVHRPVLSEPSFLSTDPSRYLVWVYALSVHKPDEKVLISIPVD